MQPRRLKDLAQLAIPQRLDAIAEGLALIAEHARALRADLTFLGEAERARAYAVVSAIAEEEAGKALILFDVVRTGWDDQSRARRQLGRFYDHLVRIIYAEMCYMSPADFAEVRGIAETYRASHFLDGPNDVDFIYRNRALTEREEALYVDYIRDEDGHRWVSPATRDRFMFGDLAAPLDLVISLDRLGCTSREGLDLIAAIWKGFVLDEQTHWQQVRALNVRIVEELVDRGIASSDADDRDAARVVDRWTFPMTELELELLRVTPSALEAERVRGLARLRDY